MTTAAHDVPTRPIRPFAAAGLGVDLAGLAIAAVFFATRSDDEVTPPSFDSVDTQRHDLGAGVFIDVPADSTVRSNPPQADDRGGPDCRAADGRAGSFHDAGAPMRTVEVGELQSFADAVSTDEVAQ